MKKLKEIPKKSSIVNNLLNRVDERYILVTEKNEKISLSWDKTVDSKTIKATKELLSFVDKNDLYHLLNDYNAVIKLNFSLNQFNLK